MIVPALRDDLEILRTNSREDGSPAWMIYDALRNKYFTLGLTAFKLIKHWVAGQDIVNFEKKVKQEGLDVSKDEIVQFIGFLQSNNLIIQPGDKGVMNLMQQRNATKQSWWMYVIHHYLFFKFPLFKPDVWLDRTLKYVKFFASKKFRYITYVLGLIGLMVVVNQFEQFLTTFTYFFSTEGFFYYLITLVFIKSLHELGHAYVAKHYGCQVPSIGIAFLVMFPFLYTDTSDAWRLRDHRERLFINFAGILTEFHIAILSIFLWAVLPEGVLKSAAYFLATTSLISSITINVSPFMRFDGYYIFSDWLKVENLHPRSFALAKWWLREFLFGLNVSAPEILNPARRNALIIFAFFTWTYRFFLFLGIAFLVYHFAFKLLGILLFIIEIYWFILKPIITEVKQWWSIRKIIQFNQKVLRTMIFLGLGLFLLIFPWKSSLKIPAVYEVENYTKIFSPYDGRIEKIFVKKNEMVKKGQILIQLYSSKLEEEIVTTTRKIILAKREIGTLSQSAGNLDKYLTLSQRLVSLQTELLGLKTSQSKLVLRSPIAGQVKDFEQLSVKQWVNHATPLMMIVNYDQGRVRGLINDSQIKRFQTNVSAKFIPNDGQHDSVKLMSKHIDLSAVQTLPYLALSSNHGGPIGIRNLTKGQFKERPEESYYLTEFKVLNTPQTKIEIPGYVFLSGSYYSPLVELVKNTIAILRRESGF
jgi:putative peptide zinc metalloprotease protein